MTEKDQLLGEIKVLGAQVQYQWIELGKPHLSSMERAEIRKLIQARNKKLGSLLKKLEIPPPPAP